MNFRHQLQEAYEAGYESVLNELDLQSIKNFGTDLLYGSGYTKRQQSIKDSQDMADLRDKVNQTTLDLTPDELLDLKKTIDRLIQQRREMYVV